MSESNFDPPASAPDPSPSFSAPDPPSAPSPSEGSGGASWGDPAWGAHPNEQHGGHAHGHGMHHGHPPAGYTHQHPYGVPGYPPETPPFAGQPGYGPGMYPPGVYPPGAYGPGPYGPGYPPHQVPMAQPPRYITPTNQNPTVAAIVSFFLPGVGQMMLGQTGKGAIILGVALFTAGFCGLINVLAVVDALAIGGKLKRGQPVKEFEFF